MAVCVLLLIAGAERSSGYELVYSLGESTVADHFLSDGTPMPTDAGYRFELGTFVDQPGEPPFVPNAGNTDEWLAHWVPLKDASGEALSGANMEYGVVQTVFGTYKGFHSGMVLDHDTSPFSAGRQMYVWGYDQRDTPGSAQWVLMTNTTDWTLNEGGNPLSFAQTFEAGSANEFIIGSVVDGAVHLGEVTISNSSPPTLAIADAETGEAAGVVSVVIALSQVHVADVSVDVTTAGGTASAGGDFSTFDGRVTIAAGQTAATAVIAIADDGEAETEEVFSVNLSSPTGAGIADGTATVTIRDDDAPRELASSGGVLSYDPASGTATLSWQAVEGREYAVEYSYNLDLWQPVAGGELVLAGSANEQFVLPEAGEHCFFRVVDLAPSAP